LDKHSDSLQKFNTPLTVGELKKMGADRMIAYNVKLQNPEEGN
jgi:hypothetical protein